MFVDTLSRSIEEQNYKLSNYPLEKPNFDLQNEDKEFEPKSFEIIKGSLIENYKLLNEIFYSLLII